jgi:hypothetical protein
LFVFHKKLLKKKSPVCFRERTIFPLCQSLLFSFEAITASTAFRVAITRITHVNFAERTIIARAVVLTFGYTATNRGVDFLSTFVHHSKNPPLKGTNSIRKERKDY